MVALQAARQIGRKGEQLVDVLPAEDDVEWKLAYWILTTRTHVARSNAPNLRFKRWNRVRMLTRYVA